ncbi:MAG TPA: hypothetical protein VFV36_02510 [Candidatus Methylomirabilis sp.]|nr:hypothetical protein [Candidatus Methylomirabilis sp.]
MEGSELARAAEGRAPVIPRFSATERAFDRRFLRDLPGWLRNDPDAGGEVGRFNGRQKLNTVVTGLSLLLATVTGL